MAFSPVSQFKGFLLEPLKTEHVIVGLTSSPQNTSEKCLSFVCRFEKSQQNTKYTIYHCWMFEGNILIVN